MYQINLRAQASKLASLTARWQIARVQQCAAEPRQRISHLRAALVELANLATLRVMPGSSLDTAERPDPRDPHYWLAARLAIEVASAFWCPAISKYGRLISDLGMFQFERSQRGS
jgi:hypothetical protein